MCNLSGLIRRSGPQGRRRRRRKSYISNAPGPPCRRYPPCRDRYLGGMAIDLCAIVSMISPWYRHKNEMADLEIILLNLFLGTTIGVFQRHLCLQLICARCGTTIRYRDAARGSAGVTSLWMADRVTGFCPQHRETHRAHVPLYALFLI